MSHAWSEVARLTRSVWRPAPLTTQGQAIFQEASLSSLHASRPCPLTWGQGSAPPSRKPPASPAHVTPTTLVDGGNSPRSLDPATWTPGCWTGSLRVLPILPLAESISKRQAVEQRGGAGRQDTVPSVTGVDVADGCDRRWLLSGWERQDGTDQSITQPASSGAASLEE